MTNYKVGYCVALDEKTIKLLAEFSKDHSISRSASVRIILNSFFLKRKEFNNGLV